MITLSPGVPETRQSGVAQVNTGRIRRTVFSYDQSPPPKSLRVEGLDYLRAVILTDEQPQREQAPLVEPAVKFAKYSERVTAAAGDEANPDLVADALAGLRNNLPLVRALGFNGVETCVRWVWVERQPGVYDWSYYDAILNEIEQHGLQWFPMLLAGPGYALPAWLYDSTNNLGFKCLEHGIVHDTQTIFHPLQTEYASHFIAEFGKHYGKRKSLRGIRLGPSGDSSPLFPPERLVALAEPRRAARRSRFAGPVFIGVSMSQPSSSPRWTRGGLGDQSPTRQPRRRVAALQRLWPEVDNPPGQGDRDYRIGRIWLFPVGRVPSRGIAVEFSNRL